MNHRTGILRGATLLAALAIAPGAWAASTQDLFERNHELMELREQLDGSLARAGYDKDIARKLVREHEALVETLEKLDGEIGGIGEATRAGRAFDTKAVEASCGAARAQTTELQSTLGEIGNMKSPPKVLVEKNDLDAYGATLGRTRAKLDETCTNARTLVRDATTTPPVAKPVPPAKAGVPAVELAQTRQIKIDAMDLVSSEGTRDTYHLKARVRGGIEPENLRVALLLYPIGGGEAEKAKTMRDDRDVDTRFTVDRAKHARATFVAKDMSTDPPTQHEAEIWNNPAD